MIKKFFAIAAMAAMLIACGEKPEPEPTPNPGPGTETPEEPEEPEFITKIQIDGDYADWDALAESDYVVSTLPEGECLAPVLKTFKMHADELYIYIYLEFDPRGNYIDVTDEWSGVSYLDLFIDEDNDPATGHLNKWSNCGAYMMQGKFYGVTTPYNPPVYFYDGEDGLGSWSWTDMAMYGVVTAALPSVVSESVAYFECSLFRPALTFETAETIGVGALLETSGWSTVGYLPQNAIVDETASVEENVEGDDTTEEEGTEDEGTAEPAAAPTMLYITLPPMAE